jgi:transposase InsO family protein
MAGITVRHDRDAVFTSYAWLRALLLDAGVQVSYSENGAKGNPWIESFWARFKHENHSLLLEAETLDTLRDIVDQQMRYYNPERRHSGIGNRPPLNYLESEGVAARALHSTPGQLVSFSGAHTRSTSGESSVRIPLPADLRTLAS